MSIIAYASANTNPTTNPLEDAEIDLSSVALPASVVVYGDAVDTTDPSASFSWEWTLLDPDNAGITLSSTTTQNVTISNINAWHNVRLHLVATNTATSESSETNILLAPSASFVEVRLLSENKGIQKLAKGSRAWQDALDDWADAIESAGSTLNSLSDVSNATGAQVDILVSGNVAEQNGNALHTHDGDHISDASTSSAGVVVLEEASSAVGAPKVITKERIILNGSATRSNDGTILDAIVFQSNRTGLPHVAWVLSEDIEIIGYSVNMGDGGNSGFTFSLGFGTPNKYIGSAMNVIANTALTLTPSSSHQPTIGSVTLSSPYTLSVGDVLGLMITGGDTAVGDGGHMLSVTIEARRHVV